MSRPFATWRTLQLLLGLAVLALGKEEKDEGELLGPAMPGEDKYWLKLKYISFSAGSLSPHFDPNRNDYELTIHNQDVESFTMTLSLELSKYDLLFLPRIEIDGNHTIYTPLNPLTHVVYVNEGVGPEDKTVYIKLVDPIGTTSGLFGIPKPPRANEYRIRVLQPPEFDQVVKMDNLEMSMGNGALLHPTREKHETGEYWYTLPSSEEGANVKALCNKFATDVLVNGQSVGQGATVWTDLHVPHVTWMVECLYANARWSKNVLSRTYQIHVSHLKDSFVLPVVHLMPQDGKCNREHTDDPETPNKIVCRTTTRTLDLIVTFDTTSVEVFIDKGGMDREVNVISGIQTKVVLPTDDVRWTLLVEGAHNTKVPLDIIVAQQCYEMMCPAGWVPKPALDQGENAVLHLCHGVTCNMEADATTCCREAGASCKDFAEQFECPQGRQIFQRGFCGSKTCRPADKHYCCETIPTPGSAASAQFDMHKGKWNDWWKKQDERADKVSTALGDHVGFAVQMKVPPETEAGKAATAAAAGSAAAGGAKSLQEMKLVEKVLQTVVATKTGTLPDRVNVVAQASRDPDNKPAVTYSMDIKLESGSTETLAVFSKCQHLVEGDALLKLVQSAMKEQALSGAGATGISAEALEVTWKSKVTKRIAPSPSLEVSLDIKVPKAADLGREGGEEELQPQIVAALKTAMLGLADVPEKEKIKLSFKKKPPSPAERAAKVQQAAAKAGQCGLHPSQCREEIMRVVDTNGDSLLAQTEIDQLQATSPELAQVDLKKVDADSNGEISSEELEAALGGGAQGSQAPSHEGAALYTAASSASQDGDEILHVSGKIVLPHGKEGSKEILEAKFRTPATAAENLNKVMRTVVAKDEKSDPHVVGSPDADYEVSGVVLGKVSESAVDSMAEFGTMSAPHFKKPKGEASRRGALKAWLKLKGSTTEPPMMGMAQIRSITKQCLTAPSLRKMGLRSSAMDCEDLDRRQAWFYSYQTGALQSAFGLCLSADLNGPPPSPGHAESAEVLQGWISYRGPTSTVQWACDRGWGQTWTYEPSTGMFRLNGGFNQGMCLEQLHQSSTLVVALCDGSNFHQQFWFNSIDESKMLMQKAKTAADVPIFAKPYFDGEEAIKSKDSTYDAFRLAKFAKTRAVWYLSQGCSPVPTASCGTPAPDMPGVYVGESVLQLGKKVEMLPWQSAMVPSPVRGSSLTMCYYDHSCSSSGNLGTAAKLRQWTKGCNAGGKPSCRYCGSGNHPECPKYYNCIDGGLATGEWTEEHRDWCCTKFSIGCEKPYHCLQGLENWRSWEQKRKDWCCSYQLLACEDECSKTDEATFRENHHFWCSSFGASVTEQEQLMTDYERFEKMLEKMYEVSELQPGRGEEKQQLSTARSHLPHIAGVALFLALGAAAALMVLAKQRSRNVYPVTEGFALAAGQEEVLVAAA